MKFKPSAFLVPFLLLTGCDAAINTLANLYAKPFVEKAEAELDMHFVCAKNFEIFAEKIKDFRKLYAEKKLGSPFFLSKEMDEQLLMIVADHNKREEEIDKPKSDIEKLYPEQSQERRTKENLKENDIYVEKLSEGFPTFMNACKDSLAQRRKTCNDKYGENFNVKYDCKKFYEKRAYWEMLKLTAVYKTFDEKDVKVLKAQFEDSFEDDLKKRAAARK